MTHPEPNSIIDILQVYDSLDALLPDGVDALAVALSGGRDSMALTHILKEYCQKKRIDLTALIVDHNLRADSADEAKQASTWCETVGIEAEILTWQGLRPTTSIQEQARDIRYQLLSEACRLRNIQHLLTAHQADDDVETFWMRLNRSSGLTGLSAIPTSREVNGDLTVVRPFLKVTRQQTTDYCKAHDLPYIDDPSNKSEMFERIAVRNLFHQLSQDGSCDIEQIATAINRLKRADEAITVMVDQTFKAVAQHHELGYVTLNRKQFLLAPKEIKVRLLARLLALVTREEGLADLAQIETLETELSEAAAKLSHTLGGCLVTTEDRELITIMREARHLPEPIKISDDYNGVWDGRFNLAISVEEPLTLKAVGETGLNQIKQDNPKGLNRALPDLIYLTLPSLWRDGQLVGVAGLDYQLPMDFSLKQVTFG